MAEPAAPPDDLEDHELATDRAANLAKKPSNKKKLFEIYKTIQKAFEDQNGRSGEINDFWDIYNCVLGRNQTYSGDNELFIPAVYNAVEARVTRFSNQIFPSSGRHLEVLSSDDAQPRALTALGEHYVRKSKLRLVVPSLLVNGDVEGHYWIYTTWSKNSRFVLTKVKQPVIVPELGQIGESEDIEEEEIFASHPHVEVLSDSDIVVCPATADSLDDALNQGGSITILRRWTEDKIDDLIEEGLVDKKEGETLIKEMSKHPAKPPSSTDREKDAVYAAGIKGTGRSKHALVYETWTKKIDGRLTQTFFAAPDKILHCHRNPLWCDRLPLIGHPARKIHGVYKGRSPIAAVGDLQYFINDMANQGADSSNRSLNFMVMTDPLGNPRYDSMIIAQGAVWKCAPGSTQVIEVPQLWKDAGPIIAENEARIMQTLGVNPAMITQGFRKAKPSQAEVAQEHAVDLLTTANAVTVLEEGILTPWISLIMEMDAQYRNEAIVVRAYGEMGQAANMEKIEPIQMGARFVFRWFGVEQARNAQQLQQQIAIANIVRGIGGENYPEYVLNMAPFLVNLVDNAFGPLQGRIIFKKVADQETATMKAYQMLLQKNQQAGMPGAPPGAPPGNESGGEPRMGAQPGQGRPAQNPPGAVHAEFDGSAIHAKGGKTMSINGYSSAQIATAKESWAFWRDLVTTDYHAAAWLGNEDGETSFHNLPGDDGEAHGPAQMHLPRILEIKAGCGIDIRTASHLNQLRAIHWEITEGWYKSAWPKFIAAPDLMSAATVLVRDYEQSADQTRDIARRTNLGIMWMKYFGGAAA